MIEERLPKERQVEEEKPAAKKVGFWERLELAG